MEANQQLLFDPMPEDKRAEERADLKILLSDCDKRIKRLEQKLKNERLTRNALEKRMLRLQYWDPAYRDGYDGGGDL